MSYNDVLTTKGMKFSGYERNRRSKGYSAFGLLRLLFLHSLLTLFLFSKSLVLHLGFPPLRGFFLLFL